MRWGARAGGLEPSTALLLFLRERRQRSRQRGTRGHSVRSADIIDPLSGGPPMLSIPCRPLAAAYKQARNLKCAHRTYGVQMHKHMPDVRDWRFDILRSRL